MLGTLKAGKGGIALVPRNLGAGRKGKKKFVWFVYLVHRSFSEPDNKGKGNEYMTYSVTENGCLP